LIRDSKEAFAAALGCPPLLKSKYVVPEERVSVQVRAPSRRKI